MRWTETGGPGAVRVPQCEGPSRVALPPSAGRPGGGPSLSVLILASEQVEGIKQNLPPFFMDSF